MTETKVVTPTSYDNFRHRTNDDTTYSDNSGETKKIHNETWKQMIINRMMTPSKESIGHSSMTKSYNNIDDDNQTRMSSISWLFDWSKISTVKVCVCLLFKPWNFREVFFCLAKGRM